MSIILARVTQSPEPLTSVSPDVLPQIDQLVMKTLARDPKNRFPDMRAFGDAVKKAISEIPAY